MSIGFTSHQYRPSAIACNIRILALICLILGSFTEASKCYGQEIERLEPDLIDAKEPFDVIVVTEDKGGEEVKILTLSFRETPPNVDPKDKLEVVITKFPDRRYEIAWRYIDKILYYEQRIYDEAKEKMAAQDYSGAFQNLSFLLKNYPNMPNLEQLRLQFIFDSALERYKKGELRQTLSALEELRLTAPAYEANRVMTALSRVADSLITEYQEGGDLGSAQTMLDRMKRQYGPDLPVVTKWEAKLEAMARAKLAEARRLADQKKYRAAWKAAVQALGIFPDVDEVKDLMEEINRTYPMIRVGVMQRSGALNPSSLVDWPARRAGSLVSNPLFRFLETGGEGGRYGFSLGTFRPSDDRRQLFLNFDNSVQTSVLPFDLAQKLVNRSDPEHEIYDPSWAAIFESVQVRGPSQLMINLRRPNVLPHALMQWLLPNDPAVQGSLPGEYQLAPVDRKVPEMSFKLRGFVPGESESVNGQPVEIVEIFYDDPKEAVNDLLLGDIDVLDQLYPADAVRLKADERLLVGRYALPTSHMLIPISDHAYLQSPTFRRALLCATDRDGMLRGELLNSDSREDGRLISGPFPIGDGDNDPLAYAYNNKVTSTEYSPPLARLLLLMTTKELVRAATKKREPEPKLEKLLIGCPDFEFARVAVQAMIQQWTSVGIKAEMVLLKPEEINKDAPCDLVYVITTMWEPATDIERLLGGNGLAATDNSYIVQGLERLRECRNWPQIRSSLQEMHQLIDYHLPILPLWQVRDRYAISRKVEGLRNDTVSLYQDIQDWRILIDSSQPVSRK
ncbi:MAG: ABC transporter substrate-binding protein [Planctomycetota bacterium]